MKEIVVFTAKEIGFNLVNFLISEFPQDNYTVIVCDPDKDYLVEKLLRNGIRAESISTDIIERFKNFEDNSIDWLLNLWGGHIFDESFLSKFKKTLNIHPSLLPYCRGRDPIVWALRYPTCQPAPIHFDLGIT
jgi:folate-dependent phosphoribosylglycinamide formyltransferase PurN